MLFETLFQGRNLLIMAALGVLIVLVAVVCALRMTSRMTPEDVAFYKRLAKQRQRQAFAKLVLYGLVLLGMLYFVLSRRR